MAESSNKDVIFTLRAVVDPASRAVVESFGAKMKEAGEAAARTVLSADVTAAKRREQADERRQQKLETATKKQEQLTLASIDRQIKAEEAAIERLAAKRAAAAAKLQSALKTAQASPSAESAEVVLAIAKEAQAVVLSENARVEALQKTQKEREKLQAAHDKLSLQSLGTITYASNQEVAAHKTTTSRVIGNSESTYQTLMARVRMGRREIGEAGSEMTESLMRVTRGFVTLGLAGEKDLDKIMRRLMKVQAAFDLVSGSVKVVMQIEKALHGYRTAALAAAAAQEVLNTSQARGVAIGGGGLLASIGGTVIQGRAGRQAAARAAEVAAMGAGAYLGVGGASAGAGGGVGGSMIGGAATGGAIVAALVGLVGGITSIVETIRDIRKTGSLGGGSRSGSWNDTIGGSILNPAAWMQGPDVAFTMGQNIARSRAFGKQRSVLDRRLQRTAGQNEELGDASSGLAGAYSENVQNTMAIMKNSLDTLQVDEKRARVAEALARHEASHAKVAQINRESESRFASERIEHERLISEEKKNQASLSAAAASLEGAFNEKRRALRNAISVQEREAARIGAEIAQNDERFAAKRAANESMITAARQTQKELINEQIALERTVAEERKAAAREQLHVEEQTLQSIENQAKAKRGALLSAREQFATMSAGEQNMIIRLNDSLKKNVPLTNEQLSRLSPFRGLPGIKAAFDKQLDDRAQRGGFGKLAGPAEKELADLEAKATAQRAVVANLETQVNVTINANLERTIKALDTEMERILRKIEADVKTTLNKFGDRVTNVETSIKNRANP